MSFPASGRQATERNSTTGKVNQANRTLFLLAAGAQSNLLAGNDKLH